MDSLYFTKGRTAFLHNQGITPIFFGDGLGVKFDRVSLQTMKQLIIRVLSVISIWAAGLHLSAQEIVPLYTGSIPGSKTTQTGTEEANGMIRKVYTPTLEVFLPEKEIAVGSAVIICPGGGYGVIVYNGEGVSAAKSLAQKGIAAFVLKYRLPDDALMGDKKNAPLQDAQQAIKLVRENAEKWNINPEKIGIMGFSAGGHLASTAATHFKKSLVENKNNTSLRPDFQILVYPVISMQDGLTHRDSKRKLLGSNPDKATTDLFSNELQVDSLTPPVYLTHSADDVTVDVDNSIFYFEKLRKNKVPVEMHIYPKGGHGFIFRHQGWMDPLFAWMKTNKWMN